MSSRIVYVVVTPDNSIADTTEVFSDPDDAENYLATCGETSFIEEQPILNRKDARAIIADRSES